MLAYGKKMPRNSQFSVLCPEKINYYQEKNLPKILKNLPRTRMHSSRMRTARSLTVCQGASLPGGLPVPGASLQGGPPCQGVSLPRGISLLGGLPAWGAPCSGSSPCRRHPPCGQTHTCKKHNLRKLPLRAVKT